MFGLPMLAVGAFLISAGASFFFALAETALFALGKWQTRQLVEAEPRRGAQVAGLLAAPQDLLATLVLGNTGANAGLVVTAVWLILNDDWEWWLVLPLALLGIILVGEVLPKTLAVRAPGWWALRVVGPMHWCVRLTRPVHQAAQRVNSLLLRWLVPASLQPPPANPAGEYAELVELAAQQGALRPAEKEIILQIASLERRKAREMMTPRARMICLADDLSLEEMVAVARKSGRSRLPMYDGTPDTIVGVLNTQRLLLDPGADLAEAIEFPSFVPESINLLQLLKRLQRQRRGLAVVLDEFGSTAGLISTEDILGSMIGRLRSEEGGEGFVMERLGAGRWRVNGMMRIEDFRREYPALRAPAGVDTMGGLMTSLTEVVPASGATALCGRLRLTASVADERRVRELLVEEWPRKGAL